MVVQNFYASKPKFSLGKGCGKCDAWYGHLAHHINWAGETPTLQELIRYFFIWKSLTELVTNAGLKNLIDRSSEFIVILK
jgi:hypothetical protein